MNRETQTQDNPQEAKAHTPFKLTALEQELLEALEAFVVTLEPLELTSDLFIGLIAAARATIKKARGE